MVDLGTIQVRFLEQALAYDGAPPSVYLESAIPGKKAEFRPVEHRGEKGERYWDLTIPITEENIKFCEDNFYLVRGHIVKMHRREIKNPFNQGKQKTWLEKDLNELVNERVAEEEAKEEEKFNHSLQLATQELRAHSSNYWDQFKKAKEYGWPQPIKSEEQMTLEKELGGFFNSDLVFEDASEDELASLHELDEQHAVKVRDKGQTF